MLTHVVLMKFSDAGDAAKARPRLEELAEVVPQIRSLEVAVDELATDVSWHLFLRTTHRDAGDLRAYQDHPAHREFGAWVRPLLVSRAVVDYTTP
ncbi:Dabb family protein [Actinoplanes flavus]|uniref:Dabb family protein n=1 Tax=Actinoplanes flavus TaxID=2820290 RepID=A0ABS3UYE2_9ACTN|nr:Dabb family protein [Actinoplanes flavus]MBO3743594.1 Dabb family protein [Actinoplanes flavus]